MSQLDRDIDAAPPEVSEFAAQTVEYVRAAFGLEMQYDSDTLPVLDHYLRQVPGTQPAMRSLIAATAGAYFGEVIRRRLGGRWDLSAGDPAGWRVILPTGLSFVPAGIAAAAIDQEDPEDVDSSFDAPPLLRPHLEDVLDRMAPVTVDEYYSLCGRLDSLEHIQAVLLAVAAAKASETN